MSKPDTALPAGTQTIVVGLGDLNGLLRGKRLPASNWSNIKENGIAMSMATFAMDMTCDVWDTPYVNFDNGYPDMYVMQTGELYPIPWDEGTMFTFATSLGTDHKPVPIDPRNVLVNVLKKAAAMGYEVKVGTELEFYLLDKETLKPRDSGIQVYGLARAAELEHVLGPIRNQLVEVGIPIEQSNPEYAAGQVEVNIRYDEALKAADRVVCFRGLVKELALKHGYHATFMAKPFFEDSGNGFHVHHSLWQDDKNRMADSGRLSKLGMNYLAGLQKYMCEMTLVAAATPNAYRRRQPFSFCPINNTWGGDNRTVGLRVIGGADHMVRVEKRDGSADANPYLLLAMEIAAGLKGIEQELEPGPKTEGNAYLVTDADALPADLPTAIALAKESQLMHETIGADLLGILVSQAEREVEFFAQQVTQVETDRYLMNF